MSYLCRFWNDEVLVWLFVWSDVHLFAYGPAATASQNPIICCLILIQTGFTFLLLAYAGCPGKDAVKRV